MLHFVQSVCENVALAIKEKTLKSCSGQMSESFLVSNFDFTGSPLYEEFLGIIFYSSLYFAIVTYIN